MPSFKKREPGTRAQASSSSLLPRSKEDGSLEREGLQNSEDDAGRGTVRPKSSFVGLRPSPYPSPVPLFSTGLASLDDYITGHGLPSSSLLLLVPSIGLTSLEISPTSMEEDAASPKDAARLASERRQRAAALGTAPSSTSRLTLDALNAAESTLLDLMSYGAAQGLLAGHEVIVIGSKARDLVTKRMPTRATGRGNMASKTTTAEQQMVEQQPKSRADGTETSAETANAEDGDESMKIAFRYAHRPKFKTTVDEPALVDTEADAIPEEHRFRAPFDLSKQWSEDRIKAAEASTPGRLHISESTRYDEAWRIIDKEIQRLRQVSAKNRDSIPPIRIQLLGLGSKEWSRANDSLQNRLVQVSRFMIRLRHLLRRLALEEDPPVHTICTATISPELLVPPWQTIVTRHLLRFADAQVLLSDFSLDKHLARAYAGYGGSVSLMKGPSLGSVSAPGEKRSILRGGGGEAGAENDVGWRRRPRGRGIVLETLHEDVDADLKKDDGDGNNNAKAAATSKQHRGDDIEEAAIGLVRKPKQAPAAVPHKHDEHDHAHQHGANAKGPATPPRSGTARPAPRFEGLKSLRERGLRATKPISIDLETEDGSKDV